MNTIKERTYYTQGQQFTARVLCVFSLLVSVSLEGLLAVPQHQPAMTPVTTINLQGSSLASTPPTPPPGGSLELSPEAPGSFWGDSVGSSPAIDAALQERMSQDASPFRERELLRTSSKVNPVSQNFSFEVQGGEKVRFFFQMGQWHAEVSSRIGAFSRRSVLPVVCRQGADVASSLEVLSRYASWQLPRQIHVLDENVCPTLGEVVYVGELGLKGGGEGEASGSGEQEVSLLGDAVLDATLWERYFGHIGATPPLPDGIEEILNSPCPFWEGKQIRDTHLLVLIPEEVAGRPLTLDYLGELIERPQGGGHPTKYCHYWNGVREAIGSQASGRSYWVLMTKDVLPESRNKRYEDQCELVAAHAKSTTLPYKVPGVLEAAIVMLLHHVRSGEFLYGDNPFTFTRCREKVQNSQLAAGSFSSEGLYIPRIDYRSCFGDVGVAGLRKF